MSIELPSRVPKTKHQKIRLAAFIVLTALCLVSRVGVDGNHKPLETQAWVVAEIFIIAGWVALMYSPFRREPTVRGDSVAIMVASTGFVVQTSVAQANVILLPTAGIVLSLVFVIWVLVGDERNAARNS